MTCACKSRKVPKIHSTLTLSVCQNASKFDFQRVLHISVSGMTSKLIPESFINLSLSYLLDLDSCIFAFSGQFHASLTIKNIKSFKKNLKILPEIENQIWRWFWKAQSPKKMIKFWIFFLNILGGFGPL